MDIQSQKELLLDSGTWLAHSRILLVSGLMEQNLKIKMPNQTKIKILDFGAGAGEGVETWRHLGEVDVVEPGSFFHNLIEKNPHIKNHFSRDWKEKLPYDKYDVILMLDVLEHLEFPTQELMRLSDSTKKGGYLIITVPAYQWLFSNHDIALDHWKRYSIKDLNREIPKNFELIKISHFVSSLFPIAVGLRLFGILKYRLNKNQNRKRNIKKQSSRKFKILDKFLRKIMSFEVNRILNGSKLPFGLSIVAIYKKNDGQR